MNIYTIGVYGKSENEFFNSLIEREVKCFFDVRQRRGVRGTLYSFVNSNYLQAKLKELNIEYFHLKHLAPTNEIRKIQHNIDASTKITKRKRTVLSDDFCCQYQKEIVDPYDFSIELSLLKQYETVAMFCVEEDHLACHRSIIADKFKEISQPVEVFHL